MTVTDIQLQNSTGKIIALGHREDDYVLESADWGTAKVNINPIYYFPTDDSERMLHTKWEPRPISIIGWVIGKSEADIEIKSQELEDFLIVQSETDIIYDYYHLAFLPTAEIKWANTEVDNNEFWRKFHITGICVDPMWKNRSFFEVRNLETDPIFTFPLFFHRNTNRVVFGRNYGDNIVPFYYEGQVSGAIITLHSVDAISNLTIFAQNDVRHHLFRISGDIAPNTTIVIDTREGFNNVTANGVDITNRVVPGSVWLRIYSGMNILSFNQLLHDKIKRPMFEFPLHFHQPSNRVVFGVEEHQYLLIQADIHIAVRQADLFEVQT